MAMDISPQRLYRTVVPNIRLVVCRPPDMQLPHPLRYRGAAHQQLVSHITPTGDRAHVGVNVHGANAIKLR